MAACANSYAVCRHPSAQSCPFSHQACIDRQDEPYCKLTVLPCPTDHCYSGVGAYAGVHFRIIPYMQPLIGTNKRRTHSHKHTVDVWAKRDTKVLSHFSVVTVYLPTVRPAVGIGKATIDCCWLVPKLEHTHTTNPPQSTSNSRGLDERPRYKSFGPSNITFYGCVVILSLVQGFEGFILVSSS